MSWRTVELTRNLTGIGLWGASAIGLSILAMVHLESGDLLLGGGGVVVALCAWAALVARIRRARTGPR